MLNCAASLPLFLSFSLSLSLQLCACAKQQAKRKRRKTHLKYPVSGGKTQKTLEAIRIQQLATETKIQRYTDTKIQLQPVFTEACNLWQLLLLLEGIDIYRQLMALIIAQCRSIMDF